jgi:hypothetical protein
MNPSDFQSPKKIEDNPVLVSLKKDLDYYNDYLIGFTREVLDSGISKYPILVAYQYGGIKLGTTVLDHATLYTQWSINISALEEFVKKEIVGRDKIDEFRKHYKDPETHMCVFVVLNDEAGFVFYPYKNL